MFSTKSNILCTQCVLHTCELRKSSWTRHFILFVTPNVVDDDVIAMRNVHSYAYSSAYYSSAYCFYGHSFLQIILCIKCHPSRPYVQVMLATLFFPNSGLGPLCMHDVSNNNDGGDTNFKTKVRLGFDRQKCFLFHLCWLVCRKNMF